MLTMNAFSGSFNRRRCIDETIGKTTYKRTKTHAVLVLFIARVSIRHH